MRNADYNKPAAKEILQRMLDLLASGPATTQDLLAASGKSASRARDYLMHLRIIGRVFCIADAVFSFSGNMPAVWALDPEYVAGQPKVCDDTVDGCQQRVIVRTSWPPNHTRMTIDCYLFGVPAVLQGAQAC